MTHWWRYISFFRTLLDPKEQVRPESVEDLGLLAVKIAQMYAVRADLIGYEKSKALRTFFENATPLPPAEIHARFESVAPQAFTDALVTWNHSPAAAASVGQVHRGFLNDGTEVAIKIIKSDARKEFRRQVVSLRGMLKSILFFYPKLERVADPLGVLESVEASTLRELDLRAEMDGVATLEKLRQEGLTKLPHLRQLTFPKVYREFSNENILVTEWRPEPSLNTLLREKRFDYEHALALFRIHGYFLFLRGTFHGDLHPGNILYDEDSETFILLDNANVETAPIQLSNGILNFLNALGDEDLPAAAGHIAQTSTKPLPPENHARLLRELEKLYEGFAGQTVGEVSLTEKMMDTVKLAVDCGVAFPKQAFPLIKSLMTLDGIVRDCAPDARLLKDTRKFGRDLQQAWNTTG